VNNVILLGFSDTLFQSLFTGDWHIEKGVKS